MKQKNLIIGMILILMSVVILGIYFLNVKPNSEAKVMFSEAKIIFERGNIESINKSIDMFTKIIASYPDSKFAPASYFFIGRGYELTGLNQQAYLKYSYILKNQSKYIDDETKNIIYTRMAHLKVMRNQSDEAISDLLSLLKNVKDGESKSRVYAELGHSYFYVNKFENSLESFNHALLENGKNEEAILGKAKVLKKMGRDNEAYEIYRDFLSYFGHESQYTEDVEKAYTVQAYSSGLENFRKGNYNGAINYFSIVITKFPDNKLSENALYWTGESFYGLKNYQQAAQYFQKGIDNRFYHKDEDCRIKKGYSYFMMKRFDLAAKEFEIYLEQHERGKYTEKARKWKEAASRELSVIYNLEKDSNDVSEKSDVDDAQDLDIGRDSSLDKNNSEAGNSEVGSNGYVIPGNNQRIFLESVIEI